jgi:hypothetical protein
MQRSVPLPRVQPAGASCERARAALDHLGQQLADPVTRPALLWRAVWAPFWVWSDAPKPALPERGSAVPRDLGLAGEAVVTGIDRVRRRLWVTLAAAAICRGIWLALAFAAALMVLDVLGGPTFDPRPAAIVGVLLLLAGLVLAALSKPSRPLTARMLDHTFGLQERLSTALDDLGLGVPAPGERAPVVYLQMADAANAIAALRSDSRLRPVIPVREVVLVVFCALVLATLAFLRGLGGGLPELAVAHVPPFTPAIERPAEPEPSAAELDAATMAPSVQQVLERADRSAQTRRDLQSLAAALADHAVTRPAAEEIARGDYDAAGEQIRDAAKQAGELSPAGRNGLADDLQRASETMQPESNGLHEAARDAASGLRQDDESARTEMGDLADAVERAGQQVVPQNELASQMRNARQTQAQQGADSGQPGSQNQSGDPSDTGAQSSAGGDPGRGVDANASSGSAGDATRSERGAQPGENGGDSAEGQSGQSGESGRATTPGDANQPGPGEGGAPGNASQRGSNAANGVESGGDSANAQQGAGAGTGESGNPTGEKGSTSPANLSIGAGEDPADSDVSTGGAAEADPTALEGANPGVVLPSSSGQQGVQTSSDGGSAMRGSGAGVTAGSGFAVQGEVGDAGPDSNRVPAEHRDTVERYFSNGGGE